MKTRMWILSFLLVLSLLPFNVLAETDKPYTNVTMSVILLECLNHLIFRPSSSQKKKRFLLRISDSLPFKVVYES
jgi:hypothetical protein